MTQWSVSSISDAFRTFPSHDYDKAQPQRLSCTTRTRRNKYSLPSLGERSRNGCKLQSTTAADVRGLASHLASSLNIKRTEAQKEMGVKREDLMLNMYEKKYNVCVTDRNTETRCVRVDIDGTPVELKGRVDGIDREHGIIIEHKSRVRGLLGFVLKHERIQCHLYMKMFGFDKCHLVESFGDTMNVHLISFDKDTWNEIETYLKKNLVPSRLQTVST